MIYNPRTVSKSPDMAASRQQIPQQYLNSKPFGEEVDNNSSNGNIVIATSQQKSSDQTTPSSTSGQQGILHNYKILSHLGRGAGSNVLSIQEYKTGMNYAMKNIAKNSEHYKNNKDRVRNEFKLQSELNHPNIVRMYSHFEDEENVYMVMEQCEGGNLFEYLKTRGRLSEEETREMTYQVVLGLEYLHNNKIVHRDLKPGNIVLTLNNTLKICDFGLAVRLKEFDSERDTFCGTPNYVAPEVCKRERYGIKTDCWSFGCILFTLVTGRPPFETMNVQETMKIAQNFNKVAIPKFLSPTLTDLIQRTLDWNSSSRLSIWQIKNHAFYAKFLPQPPSLNPTLSMMIPPSPNNLSTSGNVTPPLLVSRRTNSLVDQDASRSMTPKSNLSQSLQQQQYQQSNKENVDYSNFTDNTNNLPPSSSSAQQNIHRPLVIMRGNSAKPTAVNPDQYFLKSTISQTIKQQSTPTHQFAKLSSSHGATQQPQQPSQSSSSTSYTLRQKSLHINTSDLNASHLSLQQHLQYTQPNSQQQIQQQQLQQQQQKRSRNASYHQIAMDIVDQPLPISNSALGMPQTPADLTNRLLANSFISISQSNKPQQQAIPVQIDQPISTSSMKPQQQQTSTILNTFLSRATKSPSLHLNPELIVNNPMQNSSSPLPMSPLNRKVISYLPSNTPPTMRTPTAATAVASTPLNRSLIQAQKLLQQTQPIQAQTSYLFQSQQIQTQKIQQQQLDFSAPQTGVAAVNANQGNTLSTTAAEAAKRRKRSLHLNDQEQNLNAQTPGIIPFSSSSTIAHTSTVFNFPAEERMKTQPNEDCSSSSNINLNISINSRNNSNNLNSSYSTKQQSTGAPLEGQENKFKFEILDKINWNPELRNVEDFSSTKYPNNSNNQQQQQTQQIQGASQKSTKLTFLETAEFGSRQQQQAAAQSTLGNKSKDFYASMNNQRIPPASRTRSYSQTPVSDTSKKTSEINSPQFQRNSGDVFSNECMKTEPCENASSLTPRLECDLFDQDSSITQSKVSVNSNMNRSFTKGQNQTSKSFSSIVADPTNILDSVSTPKSLLSLNSSLQQQQQQQQQQLGTFQQNKQTVFSAKQPTTTPVPSQHQSLNQSGYLGSSSIGRLDQSSSSIAPQVVSSGQGRYSPIKINDDMEVTKIKTNNVWIEITKERSLNVDFGNGKCVFKISKDGQTIQISKLIDDKPNERTYTLEKLPSKYNAYYLYAKQVLSALKPKKVIVSKLENKEGTFVLLEGERLEASFRSGFSLVYRKAEGLMRVRVQGETKTIEINVDHKNCTSIQQTSELIKTHLVKAIKYYDYLIVHSIRESDLL